MAPGSDDDAVASVPAELLRRARCRAPSGSVWNDRSWPI